jgi:G3E family GTPase
MDLDRLEDFSGGMVQVYGTQMMRYKGIISAAGETKRIVFQEVHTLMGADSGKPWGAKELRETKMVFIGKDLPREVLVKGLNGCVA